MISRIKASTWVGLAAAVLAFAAATWSVARRAHPAPHREARVVLRLVHGLAWEDKVAAYDEALAAFERLHPGVVVEQFAVPNHLWSMWVKTRLVGDNPPDVLMVGRGLSAEDTFRHFEPLGTALERPNPYNAGSPLAAVPWRETFVGGLRFAPAYLALFDETFGVPTSTNTLRLYANGELLRRHAPSEGVADFDAFRAWCEALARDARVAPIVAAGWQWQALANRYFSSQTQRLRERCDPFLTLAPPAVEPALALLRGRWSWADVEPRAGAELVAEMMRHFQPGFTAARRDDGLFAFNQQRAAMLLTGTADLAAVLAEAEFPVKILSPPLPGPEDERFGQHVHGRMVEQAAAQDAVFGIARRSPHRPEALALLQYLTSWEVNASFNRAALRLPAVREAPVADELVDFVPRTEGLPPGVPLFFDEFPDVQGLLTREIHRLASRGTEPRRSAEDFAVDVAPRHKAAVRSDLQRMARQQMLRSRLLDQRWMGESFGAAAAGRDDEGLWLRAWVRQVDQDLWSGHRVRSVAVEQAAR